MSDLRRDMSSLRKQLDEARGLNGAAGFGAAMPASRSVTDATLPVHQSSINPSGTIGQSAGGMIEDAIAEEINEPESLNLNDLGRQMVEKALERNGGNRKKAAQELGISDRTLYRRLKQYGLEKN